MFNNYLIDDLVETPLMIACRSLSLPNISLLLDFDEIDYLQKNNESETALKIIGIYDDVKDKKEFW